MDYAEFSRAAFESADEPAVRDLCERLSSSVSSLLARANGDGEKLYQVHAEVVAALKGVGHQLYSFDEDGEGMAIWCGDYSKEGACDTELILRFETPSLCEVTWKTPSGSCEAKAGEQADVD